MTSIAQLLLDKWQGNTTSLKEEYKQRLSSGVWVVEFTKVDGSATVMDCTLDPRLVPPSLKESTNPRVEPDHTISVYSLDRGGWRSFTVANVKNFYQKYEPVNG